MVAMNLDTNTYVGTPTASSQSITLSPVDANQTSLVIYNASTEPTFIMSANTAPTVISPTGSVPQAGKIIGPGATVTFTKNSQDNYIGYIQPIAGTGNIYISPGVGE